MKKKKVLLITNMISPYRIPLFNYIAKKGDFDFRVIALSEKEKNREWKLAKEKIKFNYKILSGWHLMITTKKMEIPIHLNIGLLKVLLQYNPDIIITSGYDSLAYWEAFLYCKFFRKKFILWNGTTLLSASGMSGLFKILKKIIVKGADRYIAYGTKAKEYLEYLGAKPKDIFIALNTVDIDFFVPKTLKYRMSLEFVKERKKYPKILLLYVGQLIKRKGIEQVLKALSILRDDDLGIIIVGSGPEEDCLKNFCQKNKLSNIFFIGFHQQNELPKYYALADILILPSINEVWGLVVNEALACGLFVLCSKYAGSCYDIINKKNGIIFDPYNINEIIYILKKVKKNIVKIKKRRKIIAQNNEKLKIENSAFMFLKTINSLI